MRPIDYIRAGVVGDLLEGKDPRQIDRRALRQLVGAPPLPRSIPFTVLCDLNKGIEEILMCTNKVYRPLLPKVYVPRAGQTFLFRTRSEGWRNEYDQRQLVSDGHTAKSNGVLRSRAPI